MVHAQEELVVGGPYAVCRAKKVRGEGDVPSRKRRGETNEGRSFCGLCVGAGEGPA